MVFIITSAYFPVAFHLLHKKGVKFLKSIEKLIIVKDKDEKEEDLRTDYRENYYLKNKDSINKIKIEEFRGQIIPGIIRSISFSELNTIKKEIVANKNDKLSKTNNEDNNILLYKKYLDNIVVIKELVENMDLNHILPIFSKIISTLNYHLTLANIRSDFTIRNKLLNKLVNKCIFLNYDDQVERYNEIISTRKLCYFLSDLQVDQKLIDILIRIVKNKDYRNLIGYHESFNIVDSKRYFQINKYFIKIKNIFRKYENQKIDPFFYPMSNYHYFKKHFIRGYVEGITNFQLHNNSKTNMYFIVGGNIIQQNMVIDQLMKGLKYVRYYDLRTEKINLTQLSNNVPSILLNANIKNFNEDRQKELLYKIKLSKDIKILLTSDKNILMPELSNKFTQINLPSDEYEQAFPFFLIYLLMKKGDDILFENIQFYYFKYNIYYPFFTELRSGADMEKVIDKIDNKYHLMNFSLNDPYLWCEIQKEIQEINKQKKITHKCKKVLSNIKDCILIYDDFGEAWQLSFGYSEPLSIKPMLGLLYIAYLIQNKNKLIDSEILYNKFGKKESEKFFESVDKAIRETICFISMQENEHEPVSKYNYYLSAFLQSAIVHRNSIAFIYQPIKKESEIGKKRNIKKDESANPAEIFDPEWTIKLPIEAVVNENG